jgi:hypothetical protein
MLRLSNTADKYDGMEQYKDAIYANRADANFDLKSKAPCKDKPEGHYDKYDMKGNVTKRDFIVASKPASGIAFNGKYFFVSLICEDMIAVYGKDGTWLANADLSGLARGGQFCINPNLHRCIEDLSIQQSVVREPKKSDDYDNSTPTSTTDNGLHFVSINPGTVRVAEPAFLTISIGGRAAASDNKEVDFKVVSGDLRLLSGEVMQDGKESKLSSGGNPEVTVKLQAGQPGLSIVEVTSRGGVLRIPITATNVAPSSP